MDKIKKIQRGNKEVLRFTSFNNKEGDLSYANGGFAFDDSVSQENIITYTCPDSIEIDCSKGNIFELNLTEASCSIVLKNINVSVYTFIVKQDAVGGREITFPSSGYYVESEVGVVDLSAATANQIDIVGVLCDGVNCYISSSSNFVEIGTL